MRNVQTDSRSYATVNAVSEQTCRVTVYWSN